MRKRGMSSKEHEFWTPFLLARDGYRCKICNKDVDTLLKESKPDRIRPVLIIEHIDGDDRFSADRDGNFGGNLRLSCYSCNRKIVREQTAFPAREHQVTASQRRHDINQPLFTNWVISYLTKFDDMCYKFMLNRGSKIANNSSQITVQRYFETEVGLRFELFEKSCPYQLCDGQHVCFMAETPRKEPMQDQTLENEVGFRREPSWDGDK